MNNNLCFHVIDEVTHGSPGKDLSRVKKEAIEGKRMEVQELKDNLLRRYSGYITNLRHEFSKKKKKEKLPKEAKQILLSWWNVHFKWPYPTVNIFSSKNRVTKLIWCEIIFSP